MHEDAAPVSGRLDADFFQCVLCQGQNASPANHLDQRWQVIESLVHQQRAVLRKSNAEEPVFQVLRQLRLRDLKPELAETRVAQVFVGLCVLNLVNLDALLSCTHFPALRLEI